MKARVIYIATATILLSLALAGGSILIWWLFSFWLLVLIVSYLWTQLGIRGLEAKTKKLPEHLQVGDSLDEEITIFNRSKVPKLLLEVREDSDFPGHFNTLALNLSSRGSFSWQKRIFCEKRGQYSLGSFTAEASDPFSFFRKHRKLGEAQNILIYPLTLKLPFHLSIPESELRYRYFRFLSQEVPPSVARIREYVSSDSPTHIHWRSTAHTGRLMVKVFEAESLNLAARSRVSPRYRYAPQLEYRPESVWLIPDMDKGTNLSDGEQSTEDCAITIAASLAKKYIDVGASVGLIASGEKFYLLPPQRGEEHLNRLLEALALMKAKGEMPLHQLILSEMERFGAKSAVTAITPSLNKEIVAPLNRLIRLSVITAAVILDPLIFSGKGSPENLLTALHSNGVETYIISRKEKTEDTPVSRIFPFQMKNTRGEV